MTTAARRQKVRESFSRLPGHLIRRVHQLSTAYFAEECGGDLTAVQYAALVAIGAHPGIDATRLSEIIYFDRSIGDVLDRMETKGWILRESTPTIGVSSCSRCPRPDGKCCSRSSQAFAASRSVCSRR